jgi:RimJ/RimL family protein N-acetyltransferase
MPFIATTARLDFEEFSLSDAPFIVQLLNSEGWLKYIGDRNIKSITDAENYLINGPIKMYAQSGMGLYKVSLKETNEPIGMCGLLKRDYIECADIGFAFLPEYMGKGYAAEAARNTLMQAFSQTSMEKVAAITVAYNLDSIKLLERLGFIYSETIKPDTDDEALQLYILGKADFGLQENI